MIWNLNWARLREFLICVVVVVAVVVVVVVVVDDDEDDDLFLLSHIKREVMPNI